jgi:spoIIIJ-associated protein
MSEKKEFSASSLKEAMAQAAMEFSTDEDEIKYEIITGKTKYFGHKQREIYIRAWVSDGSEEKELEEFIGHMLRLMKVEIDFEVVNRRAFLKANFWGNDFRLFLYQNGTLLNAIQYLLNRLFSDKIGKKIYCECENFRKNRERELTTLAHRFAKEVRRSGRSVNLKELNPFERRIVHMTINKYDDLESRSEGDSFLKVITIRKKR